MSFFTSGHNSYAGTSMERQSCLMVKNKTFDSFDFVIFDYMLYSVHYIMRKVHLNVGPGSLYYETFHYIMSKNLYIMVDLYYMLIQPHYTMYVSYYIMGYCLYMHQVDYMFR